MLCLPGRVRPLTKTRQVHHPQMRHPLAPILTCDHPPDKMTEEILNKRINTGTLMGRMSWQRKGLYGKTFPKKDGRNIDSHFCMWNPHNGRPLFSKDKQFIQILVGGGGLCWREWGFTTKNSSLGMNPKYQNFQISIFFHSAKSEIHRPNIMRGGGNCPEISSLWYLPPPCQSEIHGSKLKGDFPQTKINSVWF